MQDQRAKSTSVQDKKMVIQVSHFVLCVAILVQLLLQPPALTVAKPSGSKSRSSSSGSSTNSSTSTDTSTSTSTCSSITLACTSITCTDEVEVGNLTPVIQGALATLSPPPCDIAGQGPNQAAIALEIAIEAAFACPGGGPGILCNPTAAELETLIACTCLQDPALINTDAFDCAVQDLVACRISCTCVGFALDPVRLS